MTKRKKKKIIKNVKKYVWGKWWNQTLTVLLTLIVLAVLTGQVYAFVYKDKVYPGVVVGSFPVGGLTISEAEKTIESSLDNLRENGLSFVFRDRTVTVPMVSTATEDPDLSYEIISYDITPTILEIGNYGKSGNFFENWEQRVSGIFSRVNIRPEYTWRTGKVIEILKENLSSLERPAKDANLIIKNGRVEINEEKEGITFNYQKAITQADIQLDSLIFTPIELKLKKDIPEFKKEEVELLLPAAEKVVKKTGITITFEDNKSWYWPSSAINNLLEARLKEEEKRVLEIGISKSGLEEMLEPIINSINIEPQEPRFAIEEGKVVEFKTSENGRSIDIDETWEKWEKLFLSLETDEKKFEPVVKVIEPMQRISDVNDLGITELLGVGTSSFAGSPLNRRHNIKIGAESVNGTIIPPGEEFSLLKTLGTIDDTTGYLPELVIKGNETIPEFGGGLCQIGTTTFRGTLSAGLKVTARRNHSYSVSYYYDDKGKPGTDATIYDPAPDYRFKNDTENHVLISTHIIGDELFFEYWGTKDGRKIVQSDTRTWDIVPPPETKYVETLDLPVGETKCTESPHFGIKAAFDYEVTYSDGTVNEETFSSQYRPWQEVCLIGVEELSEEAEEAIEDESNIIE
jgi:vancomycin resistance protein YoaR